MPPPEPPVLGEARPVRPRVTGDLRRTREGGLRLVGTTELVKQERPPHVGRREVGPPGNDVIIDRERCVESMGVDQQGREAEAQSLVVRASSQPIAERAIGAPHVSAVVARERERVPGLRVVGGERRGPLERLHRRGWLAPAQ